MNANYVYILRVFQNEYIISVASPLDDYEVILVHVTGVNHTLSHPVAGVTFGAMLFGQFRMTGYGFTLGMTLPRRKFNASHPVRKCPYSLTTKTQTTKFLSANFQKMLSPSYIILKNHRLEGNQCGSRRGGSL